MSAILDRLLDLTDGTALPGVSLDAWRGLSIAADTAHLDSLTSRPPVQDSEEVRRVAALPRRPQVDLGPLSPQARALVELMNERLHRPDWQRTDCKCAALAPERTAGGQRACILSLKSAQAWALYEMALAGGLIGLLAVGVGKTAVGFLSPLVLPGCKVAVGLVPPTLVDQLVREYLLWREHWRVPMLNWTDKKGQPQSHYYTDSVARPRLHVVAYSRLSQPDSTALLKSFGPDLDLVYADEMDKLSNIKSARGSRFERAFAEVPATRFCGWTGTAWDKSIMECQHLLLHALKRGSPLPQQAHEARQWALALDPGDRPAGAGALRRFCTPNETLHEGFHRRLVETLGVVATQEGAVDVPLHLFERDPGPIPPEVLQMLATVRGGERPDNEEIADPMEQARVACEVACGFYYKWSFPQEERGLDGKLTQAARDRIDLWFERRKAWRREVRLVTFAGEAHLDSEKLCKLAAERYHAGYEGELPVWESQAYLPWREVEDTVYHETRSVWVHDYLAQDAADWAREHRGVVWYRHTAFGQRVAELSGLPIFGGGGDAEQRLRAERGDRSLVVSIQAFGRGWDGLQYLFNDQLVTTHPSSGRISEQLYARLHRTGQTRPVRSDLYQHVSELRDAFHTAVTRARFAGPKTWGSAQKLLTSTCDWRRPDEDEDDDW